MTPTPIHRRSVVRVARILILVLLTLVVGPIAAAHADPPQPAPKAKPSTARKVAWVAATAGAGFATGVVLGLHWFDDAINSDRKVWMTAVAGAIGGGVAGHFLAREISPAPRFGPPPTPAREARPVFVPGARRDVLAERVRAHWEAYRPPVASRGRTSG